MIVYVHFPNCNSNNHFSKSMNTCLQSQYIVIISAMSRPHNNIIRNFSNQSLASYSQFQWEIEKEIAFGLQTHIAVPVYNQLVGWFHLGWGSHYRL